MYRVVATRCSRVDSICGLVISELSSLQPERVTNELVLGNLFSAFKAWSKFWLSASVSAMSTAVSTTLRRYKIFAEFLSDLNQLRLSVFTHFWHRNICSKNLFLYHFASQINRHTWHCNIFRSFHFSTTNTHSNRRHTSGSKKMNFSAQNHIKSDTNRGGWIL